MADTQQQTVVKLAVKTALFLSKAFTIKPTTDSHCKGTLQAEGYKGINVEQDKLYRRRILKEVRLLGLRRSIYYRYMPLAYNQ